MEKKYVGKKPLIVRKKNTFFYLSLSILISGFLFSSQKSYATHAAGSDLTYRWISSNGNNSTYEITGTFYRDCAGVDAPNTLPITASSISCGYTGNQVRTATITRIAGTGQEITFPCSSAVTTCTNPASLNPGFQKYVYRGNITLPAKCADWVLSYHVCCRNCAITTMSQPSPCNSSTVSTEIYVEATLNNLAFASNNSPVFNNVPVAFICLGQNFTYNHGGTDVDGDSLYYELIDAKRSATLNIPYIGGFSGANPLSSTPAVTINPATGDIVMNPTALQVGVVAIRIREFRGGVLIGSVIRDMQFIVRSCGANQLPTASGINGTTKYSATVCAGSNISFTINSNDANGGQVVTMTWDSSIIGATFSTAGSPLPIGTFNWNTTLAHARSQPYQFTVTVRDDNCPTNGFQSYAYTISVPLISVVLTPSINNGYNVSCNGDSDGTILATPSGGTNPYTYSWSTFPVQTTQTATGLSSGPYTVTVTDSNNCTNTAVAAITLTQPPALIASIDTQTNVNCFGDSTGIATATQAGGVSAYSYSWNTTPVQPTQTATGLSQGTYTVTITDANGCTAQANAGITEPAAALNSTITTTNNITCNGNSNGSIDLTVTGGTGPYSYLWTPGNMTSEDLSGLDTGIYTVVVTDSLGCISSDFDTIIEPGVLVPLITSVSVGGSNLACYGDNSGSATASVFGGTFPFTYLWSPSNDTASTLTGLSAGPISVLVTDANGCTGTSSSLITQPDSLFSDIPIFTVTNINCNGESNGSFDLDVNGGTFPFSYLWSPTADTIQDLDSLPAGVYSVIITDANGCITYDTISLVEPDTLLPVITSPTSGGGYNIGCHGESSGSINSNPSGGTGPYSYLWSTSATTQDISGLAAGSYTVTVTDLNGCFDIDSITLTEPDTIFPLITSVTLNGGVNISCNGNSDGIISVDSIFGGTPPFSLVWDNPGNDTTTTVTGLSAGPILVHVVDANGCSADASDTLIAPDPLFPDSINVSIFYGGNNVSCFGSTNGTIDLYVGGGSTPYSYVWYDSSGIRAGDTTASLIGLSAGEYTVTTTDANGCKDSSTVVLTQPDTISPNEALSSFNGFEIRCTGDSSGAIDLSVSNGIAPYTYLWSTSETTEDISNLPAGAYDVTVTDTNGCAQNFSYTLNEPTPIAVSDSLSQFVGGTNVSCYGYFDGSIMLSISGGIPSYTVSWSNLATGDSIFSLGASTYTYTVTDTNSCTYVDSVTMTEPLPITIAYSLVSDISCFGGANGCLSVSPSGGTPNYVFSWSNELSTDTICNLTAGSYYATVTDTNGCVNDPLVYNLTQPDSIIITDSLSLYAGGYNIGCNGQSNGTIDLTVTGGTSGYSYIWSPNSDTVANVTGLAAGVYYVHVIDANGCVSDSLGINLTQPPTEVFSAGNPQNVCGDSTTMAATVSAGFTGTWSLISGSGTFGGGLNNPNTSVNNLTIGTNVFQWSITNGTCTYLDSVTVTAFSPITASVGSSQNVCRDSAALTGNSIPGYTGSWTVASGTGTFFPNASDSSAYVTGMTAGNNVFLWTLTNGACSDNASVTVAYGPDFSNAGSPQNICTDSTGLAGNSIAGYTGTWTVVSGSGTITGGASNPAASMINIGIGNNIVVWTLTNGSCTSSDSVTIQLFNAVTANAGSTQNVCNNSAVMNATLIPGYTGSWSVVSGSGSFSNANDSAAVVTGMTPGINVFQWSIGNGICSAGANVTVTFSPPLSDPGQNNSTCGDSYLLTGTLGPGYSGVWTVISGSGQFANNTSPVSSVTGLTIGQNNIFQWAITNGTCSDSGLVTISSFDQVTSGAGPDTVICKDEGVANKTFVLMASPPSLGTGVWTIYSGTGTIDQPTVPNATLTPSIGSNSLVWTVVNGACANSDTVEVTYKDDGSCFIELELPTGFSPNGDQFNPAYVIHGIETYPVNSFKVFNRWGNEVFSIENYKNLPDNQASWIGQNNSGEPLPEGTYFVVLLIPNSDIKKNTYVDLRR